MGRGTRKTQDAKMSKHNEPRCNMHTDAQKTNSAFDRGHLAGVSVPAFLKLFIELSLEMVNNNPNLLAGEESKTQSTMLAPA